MGPRTLRARLGITVALTALAIFGHTHRIEHPAAITLNDTVVLARGGLATRAHVLGADELYSLAVYVDGPVDRARLVSLDVSKALRIAISYADDLRRPIPLDWKRELVPTLNIRAAAQLHATFRPLRYGDVVLVGYVPGNGTTLRVNTHVAVTDASHELMLAFLDHGLGQRPVSGLYQKKSNGRSSGPASLPKSQNAIDSRKCRGINSGFEQSKYMFGRIEVAQLMRVWALSALCTSVPALPSAAQTPEAPGETSEASSSRTGPISGYMDFHFNKEEGQDALLDFHRFVLLFNHSFTPQIRFVGELELEHAFVEGLEEAGELELEQAYVDFLLSRALNIRAGMMLVPLGIINERHEPPVFNGVERPFVDTVIIPSTWFEVGAGIHGELGRGWRYRVFAMAPLDALEFSADEGIRNGRQKGAEANVRNVAFTGRAEYLGIPDLTVGAGFWTGESSFSIPRLDTDVRIGEVDARYQRGRFEVRGQLAHVEIGDAGRLNAAVEGLTGVSPNIARALRGSYGEVAYRVWDAGAPRDLVTFVRYENFDTQFRMPDGFLPLEEFDRDAWVVGATYYPDPDVAVKVDYVRLRNQGSLVRAPNSFNIGLGWWF